MQEYIYLDDGTVNFLPNRLNRQPIVVRGLTTNELWITIFVTSVIGLGLGIVAALITGKIGAAPTTILITVALGIFVGGSIIRRKKRGRPETWMYRQIQWQIQQNYPIFGNLIGWGYLLNYSGHWEIKRPLLLHQVTEKNSKKGGEDKK